MKYAGFWWRVLAYTIDTVLLTVAGILFGVVLGIVMAILFGGSESGQALTTLVSWLGGIVLSWLYFTKFESSPKMATPGKYWLGITVTDEQGQRISFGKANARFWSKIISGMILLIGYIMVAFTEKKQGLHDIIAKTLVVKAG